MEDSSKVEVYVLSMVLALALILGMHQFFLSENVRHNRADVRAELRIIREALDGRVQELRQEVGTLRREVYSDARAFREEVRVESRSLRGDIRDNAGTLRELSGDIRRFERLHDVR